MAAGDPYPVRCLETAKELARASGLTENDWILCYQSRVGRMKWLDPYTDEEIIKSARAGEAIVVVPISFVSEHSETIVELGIEYRGLAKKEKAVYYEVVPTVADNPLFIQGLVDIILKINQNPYKTMKKSGHFAIFTIKNFDFGRKDGYEVLDAGKSVSLKNSYYIPLSAFSPQRKS